VRGFFIKKKKKAKEGKRRQKWEVKEGERETQSLGMDFVADDESTT